MACGLPVVATRCFQDIDAVVENGISGLLIDVNDVQGMADAMTRLLADQSLRASMAEAGLAKVQHFAMDTIALKYLWVLNSTFAHADIAVTH
jgi:glycosyltransferase involved in cell wall biosynthesis